MPRNEAQTFIFTEENKLLPFAILLARVLFADRFVFGQIVFDPNRVAREKVLDLRISRSSRRTHLDATVYLQCDSDRSFIRTTSDEHFVLAKRQNFLTLEHRA